MQGDIESAVKLAGIKPLNGVFYAIDSVGVGIPTPAIFTFFVIQTAVIAGAFARPGKFPVGRTEPFSVNVDRGACMPRFGAIVHEECVVTVCVINTEANLNVWLINRGLMVNAMRVIIEIESGIGYARHESQQHHKQPSAQQVSAPMLVERRRRIGIRSCKVFHNDYIWLKKFLIIANIIEHFP